VANTIILILEVSGSFLDPVSAREYSFNFSSCFHLLQTSPRIAYIIPTATATFHLSTIFVVDIASLRNEETDWPLQAIPNVLIFLLQERYTLLLCGGITWTWAVLPVLMECYITLVNLQIC
jgi:hypothetical protein